MNVYNFVDKNVNKGNRAACYIITYNNIDNCLIFRRKYYGSLKHYPSALCRLSPLPNKYIHRLKKDNYHTMIL